MRTYTDIKCYKCGKIMPVRDDYIKKHTGYCMSCQKMGNTHAKKHGDYKKRLYKIWIGLKHRRYGKDVPICDSWSDYKSFRGWALSNGYSDDLTIDRINNDKGYSPKNCQWISLEENASKDKRIFSDKEKMKVYPNRKKLGLTQRQYAKKIGVSRNTIQRAEKFYKQNKRMK